MIKAAKFQDNGVWLNKHLAIIISILTIFGIFGSIVVTATSMRSNIIRNEEKIDKCEEKLENHEKTLNEINVRLGSIDTNIEYIKNSLEKVD